MFKTLLHSIVLLLGLASCYGASSNSLDISSLNLHECPDNKQFLCGHLDVPMDYMHPQLGAIELPVSIHKATQKSHGYLVFNFGGPWADNVKILPSMVAKRFTSTMLSNFDIVVINPRGANPNIIECHARDSAQLQRINQAMGKIFAQGGVNDAEALYGLEKQKQQLCQYNSLYEYVSTTNSVQDLEMLRKALNVSQLNFYMASYGTRLGLAYLVKYPQHVQRIILDGNIAPSNQLSSLIAARASGAVVTFNAFFQYCDEAGNACILNQLLPDKIKGTAGLTNRFNQLLKVAAQNHGVSTSIRYAHRPVTVGMIKNIMYTEMSPSNWRNLAQALYQAEESNSGDGLMQIYMTNTGYNPKTNYYALMNNATSASVICEDYLYPDFNKKAAWLKFNNQINAKYSQVGNVATLWLTPMCINWQVKAMPLLPERPQIPTSSTILSPHVLIIGNLQDPMTPFENAIAVRAYLKAFGISSSILQWNGLSHTALITDSPLSKCVFNKVDQFLLDDKRLNRMQCSDWQNPFIGAAS